MLIALRQSFGSGSHTTNSNTQRIDQTMQGLLFGIVWIAACKLSIER
jgi:hypothetical protein